MRGILIDGIVNFLNKNYPELASKTTLQQVIDFVDDWLSKEVFYTCLSKKESK